MAHDRPRWFNRQGEKARKQGDGKRDSQKHDRPTFQGSRFNMLNVEESELSEGNIGQPESRQPLRDLSNGQRQLFKAKNKAPVVQLKKGSNLGSNIKSVRPMVEKPMDHISRIQLNMEKSGLAKLEGTNGLVQDEDMGLEVHNNGMSTTGHDNGYKYKEVQGLEKEMDLDVGLGIEGYVRAMGSKDEMHDDSGGPVVCTGKDSDLLDPGEQNAHRFLLHSNPLSLISNYDGNGDVYAHDRATRQ